MRARARARVRACVRVCARVCARVRARVPVCAFPSHAGGDCRRLCVAFATLLSSCAARACQLPEVDRGCASRPARHVLATVWLSPQSSWEYQGDARPTRDGGDGCSARRYFARTFKREEEMQPTALDRTLGQVGLDPAQLNRRASLVGHHTRRRVRACSTLGRSTCRPPRSSTTSARSSCRGDRSLGSRAVVGVVVDGPPLERRTQ